jgi:hypothetical protein
MRTVCALIAFICLMAAANLLCFVKSKQDLTFILQFILQKNLSASQAT